MWLDNGTVGLLGDLVALASSIGEGLWNAMSALGTMMVDISVMSGELALAGLEKF